MMLAASLLLKGLFYLAMSDKDKKGCSHEVWVKGFPLLPIFYLSEANMIVMVCDDCGEYVVTKAEQI